MQTLLILLASFGAAFFLMRGVQGRLSIRSMTNLELRRAERDHAAARENRKRPVARLRAALSRNGYDGDLFPLVAGTGFAYLFLLVLLNVFGLAYRFGVIVALPVAGGAAAAVFMLAARRRKHMFSAQLVELLDLVAAQIQSGHGTHRALTMVVPTMREPMRSEMGVVLDDFRATKDLVAAMRTLQERYPSRAMSMFISALEIDRAEGQPIGPALHQASELLKKEFALAAEANAEVSQTRGEFFAVIGILGVISGKMILGSGPEASASYTSAIGLVILAVGGANMLFGVWRFLRLLNSARGDT